MGLSQELFIDQPVKEDFLCSICKDVLLNPVVAENCEHLFCKGCINEWHRGKETKTCPVDRGEIVSFSLKKPQRAFLNLLNSLELKCEFNSFGCEEIKTLENIHGHLKICNKNPDFQQPCVKECGAMLKAREIEAHNCIGFLKFTLSELRDEITQLQLQLSENGSKLNKLQPFDATTAEMIQEKFEKLLDSKEPGKFYIMLICVKKSFKPPSAP